MTTYTKKVQIERNGIQIMSTSQDFDDEGESIFDGTVPSPSGGKVLEVAFAVDDLDFIQILSDQDVVLTPSWSGGSLTAITLVAGEPYEWDNQSGIAAPFAHDVTNIVATTNSSGQPAKVQVYVEFASD